METPSTPLRPGRWVVRGALTALVLFTGMLLPHVLPVEARRLKDFVVPAANPVDVYRYFAQVQAAHHGRWFTGSDYLYEHVDDPFIDPKLNQAAAAVLSWPLFPDFRAMYLWIGLLQALGLAFIVGRLFKDDLPEWGPFIGVFLVVMLSLDENMNRLIHPQGNAFLILAFSLYALRKLIEEPSPRWWVAGGCALGVLHYFYPFYWMYAALTWVLVFFWTLAAGHGSRNAVLLSGLLAVAIDAPGLWHQLRIHSLPEYQAALYQIGFIHSRLPSPYGTVLIPLILASLPFWAEPRRRTFFALCFVSGFLCLNQHVLSGVYIPMGQTHFALPLVLVLIWAGLEALRARRALFSGWVWLALALVFFARQYDAAAFTGHTEENARLAAYRPALLWLTANAKPDSVVLSEEPAASYVAAFTPLHPYVADYCKDSLTPIEETRRRKLEELALFFFPESDLEAYARANFLPFWGYGPVSETNRARVFQRIRRLLDRETVVSPMNGIPDDKVTALIEEYKAVQKDSGRFSHRLDYLMLGPVERNRFPGWKTKLPTVYSDDNVIILDAALLR